MGNAPKQESVPPFWHITKPDLAARYGIICGIGDRWELDAKTARQAKSEGWAEFVPRGKPKAKT
jgi:hypothetical protein